MKPEDVDAGLLAVAETAQAKVALGPGCDERLLRAALAAVIPLIEARERERAAVVAEAFPARSHGALATAPYAAAEQAAEEIAAAIRAQGEP